MQDPALREQTVTEYSFSYIFKHPALMVFPPPPYLEKQTYYGLVIEPT